GVLTTLISSLSHRPTRSTLFPYTTLFRSHVAHAGVHGEHRILCRKLIQCRGNEFGMNRLSVIDVIHVHPQLSHRLAVPREHVVEDRKSTRLNSSHGSISYAVFCLKKKNNQ